MLHRIEADRTAFDRVAHAGRDIVDPEHLQQPQDLHELALALLAHARLEQAAQRRKRLRQLPAGQRSRLVERADLALQQRQVMQRVEHEVFALVGADVPGDDVGAAGDHHRVDVAADQHLAMAVGGRHRVVGAAVAHQ